MTFFAFLPLVVSLCWLHHLAMIVQDEQQESPLRVGDVVPGTVDGIRCEARAVGDFSQHS